MDESPDTNGADPSADRAAATEPSAERTAATDESLADRAQQGQDSSGPADTSADRTEVVRDLFDRIPFHQHHDIEILMATPRRAETRVPFDDALLGNPELEVIHGGVISALVDLTGAAVFAASHGTYTPTINVRVDYLEAAGREPLYANATVERIGNSIGVARVEVESGDVVCASGTGVYRLPEDE